MFKNLRTSTKLVLLCAVFLVAVGATTYGLVAEKQISIAFARKELIGSKFLATLRAIYFTVLTGRAFKPLAAEPGSSTQNMLEALAAAQNDAATKLQTAEFVQDVADGFRPLAGNASLGSPADAVNLLAKMQRLAARVADDSNLTLDPELDTYYVQNVIADLLPKFLGRLGEMQIATGEAAGGATSLNEARVRFLVLDGLIGSTMGEIKNNLMAAYRGNADESLQQVVDSNFAALFSATDAYLAERRAGNLHGNTSLTDSAAEYKAVLDSADRAWTVAQLQLDRLLHLRIHKLLRRMYLTLAVTGALIGLSVITATMTYRHTVRPLKRLEKVASSVSETKNYDLRMNENSTNEIGRLASAFDGMLAELASARDRERLEQSELARVARLTTAGVMTASIAHEIKQPLAAIVANGNAAQRWLSNASPNLIETRSALKHIIEDGHRVSQIIDSVRAMFKKDGSDKDSIDVNDLLENILTLVHREIQRGGISVRIDLPRDLPRVLADRTQLQQVFVNLARNAVEAMGSITDREKLLVIEATIQDPANVLVAVRDSGTGIDPEDLDRIFDPFFTTKSDGMGMGLSICRSIVESYGGHLWASRGESYGAVFFVVLPTA